VTRPATQLVDDRRRGRVDLVLIRDPEPDEGPVALGNGLEIHSVGGGDVVEPDQVGRGHLRRVRAQGRRVPTTGVIT